MGLGGWVVGWLGRRDWVVEGGGAWVGVCGNGRVVLVCRVASVCAEVSGARVILILPTRAGSDLAFDRSTSPS